MPEKQLAASSEPSAVGRKVDIASVKCRLCRMVNALNADGVCKHCEVSPRAKDQVRVAKMKEEVSAAN